MTSSALHVVLLAATGATLLAAVVGNALGVWRLSPSVWPIGQAIIRLGMGIGGACSLGAALIAWMTGATWRERVAWELAADFGIALLALGLLVGAVERDILRRGAAVKRAGNQHRASQGD